MLDKAFQGDFNVKNYIVIDANGATLRPVRQMPVSSAIWTPAGDTDLKAGLVPIAGYAWSGLGRIAIVEVSTDNGNNWNAANITKNGGQLSSVRLEHAWDATSGQTVLLTHATDERGTSQPSVAQWNQSGYQCNAVQRTLVTATSEDAVWLKCLGWLDEVPPCDRNVNLSLLERAW